MRRRQTLLQSSPDSTQTHASFHGQMQTQAPRKLAGPGRLWTPAEMSVRNADTHLAATSGPISGACHSARCVGQRLTPPPPPLRLCQAAASAESTARDDQDSPLATAAVAKAG